MEVKKIAVIGSGLMGSGIAYVSAWNGFDVTLNDIKQEFIDKGMERIRNDVMTGIDKGKMSITEAEGLMSRLKGNVSLEDAVKDADLIIEAIFENMDVKKEVFAKVDAAAPAHTILATNTSSLSIDELATATKRPDKFIGMHYFSPVAAMKLLELVIGEKTSDETIATAEAVGAKQNKTTVRAKNSPGFIVNRILMPVLRESILLYEQGVGTMEEIDTAMVAGAKFAAGPFALGDFVGLDVAFHAMSTLYRELGDCFKPPDTLKKLVDAGHIGNKSKKGFYDYSGKGSEPEPPKGVDRDWLVTRISMPVIREAMILVDEGIATKEDIDKAMILGASFPEGPFAMAERIGMDKVKAEMTKLHEELGDCYSVPKMLQ
ncbi:MAG: 3-hydroxyacyl-CoA dehydrogenase NAD-binding domain-containing protein [Candidatus Thorarchaeota archaeon]|nr:MAG: 3-hydroxybutyryl-CoA dehydrogenase [Candidatus Thorarchaeota archaeon]RLI57848.1 MAG: 3-hydroxybutyryl-CoA dehydrogenase [Candidatus Thorarchaeota archaeon]